MNTDYVQIIFGNNVTTVNATDGQSVFTGFVGSENNTLTAWNFDPNEVVIDSL